MIALRNLGFLKLFKPDPLLGWSLVPNVQRDVGFRPGVSEHVGPDGWRVVVGAPARSETTIGFCGCSFTYGFALADHETFTSILQSRFPAIRMLNRGVGGHGTVQSYLQFRRDVRRRTINAGVFCIISDHRYRNYAHPIWMRRHLEMRWHIVGIEHLPRARIDRKGAVWIEYLPIWQRSLLREDFDFVFPDEYTLDTVTLKLLEAISGISVANGIPILIALLDNIDGEFSEVLHRAIPQSIDVSTPYDNEHTFLPNDIHPNAKANLLFAQRLYPHILSMSSGG
jgi:hypothetical protein